MKPWNVIDPSLLCHRNYKYLDISVYGHTPATILAHHFCTQPIAICTSNCWRAQFSVCLLATWSQNTQWPMLIFTCNYSTYCNFRWAILYQLKIDVIHFLVDTSPPRWQDLVATSAVTIMVMFKNIIISIPTKFCLHSCNLNPPTLQELKLISQEI